MSLARPGIRSSRRGLTLLEVLLAIGLLALVSMMMFMFYETIMRQREIVRTVVRDGYLAKTIAHQIAEEIRAANGFAPTIGPGISGTDRLISIQTVKIPDKRVYRRLSIKDRRPPAECDIRKVQYYLAYDDEVTYVYEDGTEGDAPLGLVRREIKTLYQTDQIALAEEEKGSVDLDLISPELTYIRFRYFDGVIWLDRWDIGEDVEGSMGNSLPQAVEITVGYLELQPPEEEEEELDFEDSDLLPSEPEPYSPASYSVLVRLPQADTFLGSRVMRAQRQSSRASAEGS